MTETNKKTPRPMAIFESVFDITYLLFDLIAGIIFFTRGQGKFVFILYGILAFVLGIGDAFHLVPRVRRYIRGEESTTEYRLGLGLKVSSITMTVFYLVLYEIYQALFGAASPILAGVLFIAAAIRIIICLFPQNNWYHYEGNQKWSVYRNVVFAIVGICMIILYIQEGPGYGYKMAAAVAVSFACYLPVTLFAKKHPAIGFLMMPKTIAYVCMIVIGLKLL